eukprot:764181-Prorocentrum_minimum.AAC.5
MSAAPPFRCMRAASLADPRSHMRRLESRDTLSAMLPVGTRSRSRYLDAALADQGLCRFASCKSCETKVKSGCQPRVCSTVTVST